LDEVSTAFYDVFVTAKTAKNPIELGMEVLPPVSQGQLYIQAYWVSIYEEHLHRLEKPNPY
jgi:hypothetical protein